MFSEAYAVYVATLEMKGHEKHDLYTADVMNEENGPIPQSLCGAFYLT